MRAFKWHQEQTHIDKLRVGYLSSDFGDHPVGRRLHHYFAFHNSSRSSTLSSIVPLSYVCVYVFRIESVVLALSPPDDSIERDEIERSSSSTLQLWSLPDGEKLQRIRDAKLHVLLNLNGYTAGARNDLVFAGLASVQVSLSPPDGYCLSLY